MVGDLSELILDRPCSPFSVTTDVFAPLAEWSGCEGAGIFSNAWNQEAARLCQRRGFSCRPGTGTERPGRPQICPECAHSPARACGFWRVSESPASRPPALPSGSSGQLPFAAGTHPEGCLRWQSFGSNPGGLARTLPGRLGPAAVLSVGLRGAPALTCRSGRQEAGGPLVSAAVSRAIGEEVEIGRVMMPRSSPSSLRVTLFP